MTGWMAAVCAAALMMFSDEAMQSALRSAQVFVNGVMPALFPLMVLSRVTPASVGGWRQAALFGWVSGSPAAAQRLCAMWDAGRIGHLEKLLCLTGVMSPMFFTGTLHAWGVPAGAAWRMLGCHWLGAALLALLWRDRSPAPPAKAAQADAAISLPAAIYQSARSMLAVCGAMMVFAIVAGVLRRVLGAGPWTAVLWAMLEIGGGAHAVLQAFHQPYALLCGLCSFGGLSIWLQNLLFTGERIRPAKLLGMRALHGAVSFLLYFFSLKIQNLLMT